MKRKNLIAAVLLAAMSVPALAQNEANPNDADIQRQIDQGLIDLETSRGMTPEEIQRWAPLIQQLEQDAFGIERIEAKPREFVRGPFLGVNAEPLDIESAKKLGLKRSTGLLVNYIAGSGPAWDAGLKKGDVLTMLNDQVLVNAEQFAGLVRSHKIGDTVTLHGLRDGEPIKLEAKLGEADVSPLGPGGKDLDQAWRVQLNPVQAPIGNPLRPDVEIAPGLWIGDGWDDLRQLELKQEGLPEQMREMIKQLEQQMRQQNQDMDKRMKQLRQQLDLDIEELRGQGDAVKRMHAAIVQFDGEHRIEIKNEDGKPFVKIKDKTGAVLCDVPLPANGVVEDLPDDVQMKLHMLMMPPKLNIDGQERLKEIDQAEHIIPPAPEISNREALPNTLAALDALDKIAGELVFDVWHGADLDIAMLRDRLGLEDADEPFDRETLIQAIEAIYTKIAGNSEMRSVLSQIEVREAIKADLSTIGKTFGENKPARQRVNKLIQRINNDLLVQYNDDKHSIRLEGVGLLQSLTIERRDNFENYYTGFARVSHEFLSGKTDDPGIKEIKDLPDEIKAKVKKMLLGDKRIRSLLSDGC